MLFPFVRLEFSHSLGPPPGRYTVTPLDRDDAVGGDTDALLVAVVGAPVAEPFLRRARRAPAAEPAREVSILRVTWVQATRPLADVAAGREMLAAARGESRREVLVEHAVQTLNRAIRAYASAALDPFAHEVSTYDPRERRLGFGTGEELDAGGWTEALTIPAPARRRVRVAESVRPQMAVTGALTGRFDPLDGELHLLRALLDVEAGRAASAVRELAVGMELLSTELADFGPGDPTPAVHRRLARGEELLRGETSDEDVEETARELLTELARERETTWS